MQQEKAKVLYLITKATDGGAQRYVFDLVTHLPRERLFPVVAYGVRGRLAEELRSRNITTTRIRALARDIFITADIVSFFQILACLKRERPAVVHLNSSKAAALGAIAARITGVKRIIFTVHGWPFKESRSLPWRSFAYFVSWLTAFLSDVVICVSDDDLGYAKRMPLVGKKAVRIYNGIDQSEQFEPGEMIRNAFPAGVKITGTIGELNRNKNQAALIERANSDPTMYVAIVGEGEERKHLEKKIAFYDIGDRVKLFGFMPAAKVLKGFDVFALPSRKEGLPYVLLEAKLAELPIEANRVGGVPEILDKPLSEFTLERMVKETVALY